MFLAAPVGVFFSSLETGTHCSAIATVQLLILWWERGRVVLYFSDGSAFASGAFVAGSLLGRQAQIL